MRGIIIKQIRASLKLTQPKFGKLLGVTGSMISKYENNVDRFEDSKIFELYIMVQRKLTQEQMLPLFREMDKIKESRK